MCKKLHDKKIYVMAALGCNFTLNIWNSICIISQSISKYWKLTRTNPCRRVAAATFEIHVFSAARTASIFSLTSHFPGSRNFSMPASCRTRTPCSPGIPRTISSGYIKTNSFEVYLIQLWYLVDNRSLNGLQPQLTFADVTKLFTIFMRISCCTIWPPIFADR